MVATDPLLGGDVVAVGRRRPPKLAAPDHERVIEHVAVFEIGEERVQRLVAFGGQFTVPLVVQVVRVPAAVPDLHEPHAVLDQPAGQQQLTALPLFPVAFADVLGLAGEVEGVLGFDLHAKRGLERLDAAVEDRLLGMLRRIPLVHLPQQVELPPLLAERRRAAADIFDHLRHRHVPDRNARAAAPGRQKCVAPRPVAAPDTAVRRQGDQGGEVLVFRAQTVDRPGSQARPHAGEVAGVHQHLGDLMHRTLRLHRADHAELVGVRGQLREQLADLHPALTVLLELEGRLLELPGEPVAADEFTGGLEGVLAVVLHHVVHLSTVVLRERGFWVEGVDLRGAALAEDLDHPLRPGGEVRLAGRQRRPGRPVARQPQVMQERRQTQPADAEARSAEQFASAYQRTGARTEMADHDGLHGGCGESHYRPKLACAETIRR